jgi:hypothetical protein
MMNVVTHKVVARQGLEQIGDSAHLLCASPSWLGRNPALVPDMVAMILNTTSLCNNGEIIVTTAIDRY